MSSPIEVERFWQGQLLPHGIVPAEFVQPESVAALQEIVRRAEASGRRARAVGRGYSLSSVAMTDDIMISLRRMEGLGPVSEVGLKEPKDAERLFQAGPADRVRDVTAALTARGRELPVTTAYTGLSMIGAISTGSHGTGLGCPPFCDLVVAIELVASGGRAYRLEPTEGISNPQAWQREDIELIQDDGAFYAAVLGLGCMGIVYKVLLWTRPLTWLREEKQLMPWSALRQRLTSQDLMQMEGRFKVLINPYKVGGDHLACLIHRTPTEQQAAGGRAKGLLTTLLARLPAERLLRFFVNRRLALTVHAIQWVMKSLAGPPAIATTAKIMDSRPIEKPAAVWSSEWAVPLGTWSEAADRILQRMAEQSAQGRWLCSPISLRFVGGSEHFISAQYGGPTCNIQLTTLQGLAEGCGALAPFEVDFIAMGGRPHWGLNLLRQVDPKTLEAWYPRWADWMQAYGRLNPSGTFDNRFSD